MSTKYWQKQGKEPLYKELFWDKPENKQLAGKLLVIGGNAHGFAAPASAYQAAINFGVGVVKVLLPDSLKKAVGPILENGEYAPSNKSGSFSKNSLAEWLDFAHWSDGVLLPGDMGRNSETSIVLEQFLVKYSGQITITQDALDYFTQSPLKLLERTDTTIVANFAQLQKIAMHAHFIKAFTFDMPIAAMVENLHLLSTLHPAAIVIKHNNTFFVAHGGDVCTTHVDPSENFWRIASAASASVWTLQNPSKIFAALSSAVFELNQ